ncbi:hypothetical protein ACFCZ3_19905 [Cellulosimicrobium cellulans]|uniref:hypothetical protein n=1 Tax=Cellulosimicrobium cellulans TaxID=1710 RepID=UPI0035D7EAB9
MTDVTDRPAGVVVDFAAARAARAQPAGGMPPSFPPAGAVVPAPVLTPPPPAVVDHVVPAGEVIVDPTGTIGPHRAERAQRPILPGWMKDRGEFAATSRWAARYGLHFSLFHLVRSPLYVLRLVLRAPVGLWRVLAAAATWLFDLEHREDYNEAMRSARSEPAQYLKLVEQRSGATRTRLLVTAVVAALLAAVVFVVVMLVPEPVQAALVVVLVLALGVLGRKPEERVTARAADTAAVPPLTARLITEALAHIGIAAINAALKADEHAIRYPLIVRDGPGFRADVDLPAGVTATEVMERRDRLASGLRRPVGCVWPETDVDEHAGRLVLYVADRPFSKLDPPVWPLARAGAANVFAPIPLGVDSRGRDVEVTLMYASGIIGAIPRMGKTFTLRLILLAAALDPRVEIHAYNLKGGADLDPLEPVAHAYRAGDDPDDMEFLRRDLLAMQEDMRRRYKVLRTLPKERCPESKVTDELASDPTLGLHPIILAFDETQVMFEHADHGDEFAQLVTDLVKRGPAVGIMVWLATQKPDAKSIPTGVSSMAVLRLCLKVMGQVENDMVLGTSSYKNGVRATLFSRKDLGVAILAGEGEEPVIVRTAKVEAPEAKAIVTRALTARQESGRVTGVAAGQEDRDTDRSTVLDHLLAVWPEGDSKAWNDDLASRLAAAFPALYAGWTGENVTAAVKPHGVPTGTQVKRAGQNRRGLVRDDVAAAR